jgi:hypothetical protein
MIKKKVLICGDRNWTNSVAIENFINKYLPKDIIIVTGNARGADYWAEQYCKMNKIENKSIPANWKKYGRAAGPIRNREMLNEKPILVVAFHSDIKNSLGTKDTVTEARNRKIPVLIVKDNDIIVCPKCNNKMDCAQIELKDCWTHEDYTINSQCNYSFYIEVR